MTYDEIKKLDKAVLKFSAEWCPPCKALAPIFDEVAKENPDVTVVKIDVDENSELTQKFGVRGIPTMMRIENGSVTLQLSGALPKEELEKLFK